MPRRVPARSANRLSACLCGALALALGASARGEEAAPVEVAASRAALSSDAPPPQATDGLRRLPQDAFQPEPAFGVRYRSLFRDSGAPYTNELRPVHVEPTVSAGSVEGRANLGIPNFRGRFPLLDRGFEPEKADIKVGPIFFKVHALSAAMLGSDNVDHTDTNTHGDIIAIARLGGTLYAQLTEGLRIATSGSFVWLPTKGQFGISGYGLLAPYSLGLEGIPAIESQVSWDTMIGSWNVVFTDDFRLSLGRFSDSTRDDFALFEGGQFDQADTAGRYSFRGRPPRRDRKRFQTDQTDANVSYFSNVASVTTERLLPGPVRLRIRAYHEDLWYNQGGRGQPALRGSGSTSSASDNSTGYLARTRDGLTFHAISERENLRFNPYVFGRATETDRSNGLNEEIRLGLSGPITDQLRLNANAGVFRREANNASRFVWGLELRHLAGPYTQESIIAGSNFGDFTEELTTHFTYRIRQVVGPKNVAEAFVTLASVEDLRDGTRSRDEFRTGLRDTWYLGPRTTVRAAGIYTMLEHASTLGSRETYTLRLELDYHFTDTFFGRLLLEHHTRQGNGSGNNYDENLFFLSLTKHFD